MRGATITFTEVISICEFQPTLPLRGATEKGLKQKTVAEFQPTLPLRGATPRCDRTAPDGARFNPRSPCGERPVLLDRVGAGDLVSTHAPLAGSDNAYNAMTAEQREFQPTLPLRGATDGVAVQSAALPVSTHAPLAGSDAMPPMAVNPISRFNPRSPCGERL